jgi:hypothetical protein
MYGSDQPHLCARTTNWHFNFTDEEAREEEYTNMVVHNRIHTPYMTVYLVIYMPNSVYTPHI